MQQQGTKSGTSHDLKDIKIAVLVTSGVEEVELTKPVDFLRSKGADVTVIVPKQEELDEGIKTMNNDLPGGTQKADALLKNVKPDRFDAILIPGGFSPDHLRLASGAVDFVKAFADKPIFALCHGPQLLVSAGLVKGKTITSWPSLEIDMKNAGATWVDKEVVVDGNITTSRKPDDIPAFNEQILEILSDRQTGMRKAA